MGVRELKNNCIFIGCRFILSRSILLYFERFEFSSMDYDFGFTNGHIVSTKGSKTGVENLQEISAGNRTPGSNH